jgi:hypothetical protein
LPGVLALSLGVVAGCSKNKSGPSAVDAGVATTAASAPMASPAPVTSANTQPTPQMLFGSKLAQEAIGRPTGTPKAEDVLAAITAAGVPLTNQQQYVATTIKAHYCLDARSPTGINVSVCEYDDDAKAIEGRAFSQNLFKAISHREVVVNKKTTLSLLQTVVTPESQAAHDKAIAIFQKL